MPIAVYIWIIIGIVLVIIEAVIPSFIVLWFGMGAFVTALVSYFTKDLFYQSLAFAISSFIFIVASRFLIYTKRDKESKVINQPKEMNVFAMKGKIGIVEEDIDVAANTGLIQVSGESWRAITEEDEVIKEGEKVIIIKVDGNKLVVKKKIKGEK
ncbi:NfeD family protein [bacterium]|nr:NfeD family protein [bacterium]